MMDNERCIQLLEQVKKLRAEVARLNLTGRERPKPAASDRVFVVHHDETGSLSIRACPTGDGETYLYLQDGEGLDYGIGTVGEFEAMIVEFRKFIAAMPQQSEQR